MKEYTSYELWKATADMRLIQLGQVVERFVALYRDADMQSCVGASTEFVRYLTQQYFCLATEANVITRHVKGAKGRGPQEHSWAELVVGKKWYVVDLTGVQQFKLPKYVFPKDDYLKTLRHHLRHRDEEVLEFMDEDVWKAFKNFRKKHSRKIRAKGRKKKGGRK